MNIAVRELEPTAIWENFSNLNAVPRASKKETRVREFIVSFGNNLGLETIVDRAGNVIIKKPATAGMDNRQTVILQSHLDMVHQKNNDTVFDFETQGIEMYIEDGWVRARGTTLGADNGLGVAAMMALLEASDVEHPTIECLFTIDEETGMTGAKGLDPSVLKGTILINLDTEEDDELGVGCAGGIDVTATRSYKAEPVNENNTYYSITVKGLNGGHSGMDIHKGLANANKLLTRLLFDGFENFGLRIHEIHGGGLRNAIPREASAIVAIDSIHEDAFCLEMAQLIQHIKSEYSSMEPKLQVSIKEIGEVENVMDLGVQEGLLRALYAAPNGVYRMSPDIDGLVETSNNIAKVEVADGEINISCLTRSSIESSKIDLANSLRATFELIGCEVNLSGDYPGWTPNIHSKILKTAEGLYEQMFHEKPRVAACHAGLECGIISDLYPNLDMISFGPTILGAHSPDERANIESVKKFWVFLQNILRETPVV
ncbi:aminoacyl-histidine dipeptidase [Aegicerativicinus sediminis]|uniref:aminoacyl-histidine dipeptidase n=1 Tax=Aegicerativicinus sediminis TaxID=2893202 RepID=UPI001E4ED124|nr:aminoacyl-histidine dipeptidase [Aegicerativicinus sediminis]